MLIENIMYFALGLLVAGLFALIVMPSSPKSGKTKASMVKFCLQLCFIIKPRSARFSCGREMTLSEKP